MVICQLIFNIKKVKERNLKWEEAVQNKVKRSKYLSPRAINRVTSPLTIPLVA